MKITVLSATLLLLCLRANALPARIEITDGDNKPVAGAQVQFESFGEPGGTSVQTTDAAGRAVFEVQPSLNYPRFLGRIVAYKAGFALAGGDLSLATGAAEGANLNIALQKGISSSGTITDVAGAPIEGALVSWQLVGIKTGETTSRKDVPVLYDGPLLQRAQTRTDAAGRWSFDLLPPGGVAAISAVARGTRSARASAEAGENAPVKLAPGAIVKGKLVGLDGEPLQGINVNAQGSDIQSNEMWSSAKSGADGTYELLGLGSGEFNIMFYTQREAPYVLAASAGARTRVGETLDLGETRAQAGFEIGGVVRDDAGQPVGGAEIGVYGPRNPASSAAVSNATSDAQGRWKLRTLAGDNKIYVMGTPTGFRRESQERNEKLDGPRDNFDFVLQRTIPIRGKIVDEAGKPVEIALYGAVEGGENFFLNADENGEFIGQAPTKGKFDVTANQPYGPPSAWEIVGPRSVSAPANGVTIVVKPRVFEHWTVSARTPDGQPVAGAQVKFYYQGKNYVEQTFTSDAAGALQIRKPQNGERLIFDSASKGGFDYLDGGTLVEGAPTDVTFGARDGAARGRIVNAQGAPVAGARVWAWKGETRSDKNGAYALKDLAQGATETIAVGDAGFGRGQGEITLAPQLLQAPDKARARQIAAQLSEVKSPDFFGRQPTVLAPTTRAAWEALEPQTTKAELRDSQRAEWLQAAFDVADVSNDRLLLEARQIQSPTTRLDFADALWRARHNAPGFDAEPFRAELPALQTLADAVATGDDVWLGLRALLGYAALQQGLGDETAALQTFEVATKRLWRAGDQPSGGDSVVTSDSILGQNSDAAGDAELLLRRIGVLLDRESEGRFYFLKHRANVAATAGGLAAAQPFVTELRALLQGPQPENVRMSRPAFYAQTVRDLVAQHAASAPALALEMARSIPAETDTRQNERAETIALAALALPLEAARPLWRENIESIAQPGRALGIVSQIKARDPELAQTLYSALKDRVEQSEQSEVWGARDLQIGGVDTEKFAFYEADFAPASARFRLEKLWSNPQTRTRETVRAMAKLDAARALQWAAQLPTDRFNPNPDFWAKRDVALWLDANETQRQKLGWGDNSSY